MSCARSEKGYIAVLVIVGLLLILGLIIGALLLVQSMFGPLGDMD